MRQLQKIYIWGSNSGILTGILVLLIRVEYLLSVIHWVEAISPPFTLEYLNDKFYFLEVFLYEKVFFNNVLLASLLTGCGQKTKETV